MFLPFPGDNVVVPLDELLIVLADAHANAVKHMVGIRAGTRGIESPQTQDTSQFLFYPFLYLGFLHYLYL